MENSDKQKVVSKIQFLEGQLVSLDHYLPETYEYLMQELDLQKRILAELEVTDAFSSIDQVPRTPTDKTKAPPMR